MSFTWRQIQPSLRLAELEDALGLTIDVRGREHWASCPLPSHVGLDLNASFSIHVEKLVFKCFTCAVSGGMVELVKQTQSLDHDDALRFLAEFSDADEDEDVQFAQEVESYLSKPERPERRQHHRSLDLPWFSEEKNVTPYLEAVWHCDWVRERSLAAKAIRTFKLGFDPARQRGGYTGPAVIIPHYFRGELVGWQERFLNDDLPKHVRKYMNSDSFPKQDTLFGYDQALQASGPIVVVEGVLTTIALHGIGIPSVATFGASFNEKSEQLRLLRPFRHLVLALDNDQAGEDATRRALAALDGYTDIDLMPPVPLDKGDLNDLLIARGPAEVARWIRRATPSFL